MRSAAPLTTLLLAASAAAAGGVELDAYRVRWWGAPGSQYDRPIYQILRMKTDQLELRHAILPGRELGDYRLPYWPIRSFVSLVRRPAELPHRGYAEFGRDGKRRTIPLVVREGFDVASQDESVVLRVTNRGADAPLRMEHVFALARGEPTVVVTVRVTNLSGRPLTGVAARAAYAQDFNWAQFAAAEGGQYRLLEHPGEGSARAFFAYSPGMARAAAFVCGPGCRLHYRWEQPLNRWETVLHSQAVDLAPGESLQFSYLVRLTDAPPRRPAFPAGPPAGDAALSLPYRVVSAERFRLAPVDPERRATIADLAAQLDRPKIRGLNLRASSDQALRDLETLNAWGCNLVIAGAGDPDHTGRLIKRGHELGMAMFVQGSGAYTQGPPRFDRLYSRPLPPEQRADSHGQDEDHYYWSAVAPSRDVQADLGKPAGLATQEEKVLYWSRCFRDKWRGVLAQVRRSNPDGGVWFYSPSPGVAHVDPLDYYDTFFGEIARLGEALTVFPFYYGIDYTQPEYMIRRWKDAGARRVVYLAMRGFVSKPSEFVRAITAARRGGADGACGFAFPVGQETAGDAWQWKSVMLGAWANFPTRELDAYCLLEEPAELIELLARRDVAVAADPSVGGVAAELVRRLNERLPGRAALARFEQNVQGRLVIRLGLSRPAPSDSGEPAARLLRPGKAVLKMDAGRVAVLAADAEGLRAAGEWLVRIAELASAEAAANRRLREAGFFQETNDHIPGGPP